MCLSVYVVLFVAVNAHIAASKNVTCRDDVKQPCGRAYDVCMRIKFTPHGGGGSQSRSLCGIREYCEQENDPCSLLPWDTPGTNCEVNCNGSGEMFRLCWAVLVGLAIVIYVFS